ncbi:MAG: biopolymer transporter ExbB [Neomegalonema sp.]|nr:biopolymer transporter ExbB [Neomegalonema sp.]
MAKTEVKFTRPVQRILAMLIFLAVVGAVAFYLYGEILRVFQQNEGLNGLIGVVFVVGVILAFYQVFRLFSAVNWIEALAARARGIENVPPPSLLVAMDPMRKTPAARGVSSQTARSILDSVATRVDESRDTLRYLSGLLIFLGLLGTFWGLAKTVPAVVDTIKSLAPAGGEKGADVFTRLIAGLESQLGGMGVAFASSLLGLAGSMVVGFLELMSAGAQNRFYGELETWLSTMTRFSSGEGEGGAAAQTSDMVEQLAYSGQQMAALNRIIAEGEDRRAADSARIAEALQSIERIASNAAAERETIAEAVTAQSRMLAAVERLADTAMSGGGEGLDAETRAHIRNVDVLLAKLIEESAAGRVETAEALRREMRAVGRAVSDMAATLSGTPSS